jgi:Eukaryotic aspartyl protease
LYAAYANFYKGISDAGDSTAVLGDTFLRSAYVVYDIGTNQISLAQTDFNATSSNIKEISAGSDGVPGSSTVASAVTSLSVTTGGARGPSVTAISGVDAQFVPSIILTVGAVACAVAGMYTGLR